MTCLAGRPGTAVTRIDVTSTDVTSLNVIRFNVTSSNAIRGQSQHYQCRRFEVPMTVAASSIGNFKSKAALELNRF
jgi:hypothetical protein